MSADAMPPPTPRQREFLALTAIGLSQKQIAYECGVSLATVRDTLENARERLGARNLPNAVMKSIIRGYLLVDGDGETAVAA